jgi:ABC-2 type transport system permease protein
MSALFHLTLRQILGGMKLWLLALFLGLPVILVAMVLGVRHLMGDQREIALGLLLYVLYPQTLVILAALLYGSALLSAEIEGKTLVYLLTRPIPRWGMLLTKYLATVVVLCALCTLSLTASAALAGFPGGARTYVALVVSVLLGTTAYTAIFGLLGLLVPRRAIPAGLIYAVIVELLFSFVPAFVNQISISHYLRSLAFRMAGTPVTAETMALIGDASTGVSIVALVSFPAVALILAAVLLQRREWPLTEGV